MGASRGMMVLFVKQVHLQKEVGAASEKGGGSISGTYAEEEWIWWEGHIQAAEVRARRADRDKRRMVGSMVPCLLGWWNGRDLVKYWQKCAQYLGHWSADGGA